MNTPSFDAYLRKGLTDIAGKSLREIQAETARLWTGRACAAASMGRHDDAHEFAHEAIEHAALSGNDALLRKVREILATYGVEV
jgi:hypothetical protein